MSLSSSLSWCDFPMSFVRWEWCEYRHHIRAGQTGGRRNHVSHTYMQRLILLAPPLIFVVSLVGALRGEGYDTIVARGGVICPAQYRYGLVFENLYWFLGNIPWVIMGWHELVFHTIIFHNFFEFLWTLVIQ